MLKDNVKLTKVKAYLTSYQDFRFFDDKSRFFKKLGNALHPEQHTVLWNTIYNKRTCYLKAYYEPKAHLFNENVRLALAESLPAYKRAKKEKLFETV
ncbi:MAG: hypothetical protein QRY72_01640 [Candidatus Rhabdochlamydia sp.]